METTQKTFDSTGARLKRTITVDASTGYVFIEASFNGIDWIRTDVIAETGGYIVFHGKAQIRITPFDGARYEYI